MTATCFIVPPSLNTTLSASATVVDVADVSPSTIFNSVTVELIPSRALSSAAVAVIVVPSIDIASASNVPSISALPDISSDSASTSPATVITPDATVIRSVSLV